MAEREQGVGEASQEAYAGDAGRTRVEQRHVILPGGSARVVSVHVVVDVVANPELREPALAGALHRFETGEELAVPFIYHDGRAQELVLVVPEPLRHRALRELADLHRRIAEDTAHPVPAYAQRPAIVIGVDGLAEHLAGAGTAARLGEREAALAQRDAELLQSVEELAREREAIADRERDLASREARLHERGEDLTTREDDLRALMERVEVDRQALAMREAELDDRLAALQERESQLASRSAEVAVEGHEDTNESVDPDLGGTARIDLAAEQARADHEDFEEVSAAEAELLEDAGEAVEELEDLEEISDLEEIEDVSEYQVASDEEVENLEELEEFDAVEELVADDELEDLSTAAFELAAEAQMIDSVIPAPVTPPEGFLEHHERQMAGTLIEERPWLFVRLTEAQPEAFRDQVDLLAQYALVDGYPLVLLALVDRGEEGSRPFVRRAAVDPASEEGGALLRALTEDFSAEVAVFSARDHFERVVSVAAPRQQNLRYILERSRLDRAPEVDLATASERALAAPPPVRSGGHPFVDAAPSVDAKGAIEAVSRLAKWSAPAKLDMVLMALSVPRDLVDACFERILGDAFRFGAALDTTLASKAIALGVASDLEELVSGQIAAFARVTEAPDHGLSDTAIAQNWEGLLASARDNEVAIDAETHEIAQRALASIGRQADAADDQVDPEDLPELSKEQLLRLFTHPTLRLAAAKELLGRDDADLAALSRAARKLPREEVLELLPALVARGEAAGDALIDGLSARKTFYRQACAIGLGQINLRRAVVPLVHLLAEEPSDVWREVARVLSGYGTGAVRALARAAKDAKFPNDRAALAFAHLSVSGCAKQVEKLEADKSRAVAEAALTARTLRADAERQARIVGGDEEPIGEDATLMFSRRFCASLG